MNLIKRLFNKKRYFVVFYIATTDKGFKSTGNCSVESDIYLNQKDITNQIESNNNFKNLVITNFIELSKKEFFIFYTN